MKSLNKINFIKKILILTFSISVFLYACRKKDILENSNLQSKNDFFESNSQVSDEVKRLISFMKCQPNQSTIQEYISKNGGFPIWDKALSSLKGDIEKTSKSRGTSSDTTVVIPLVLQSTEYVNAFLLATLDSTVSIELFLGKAYKSFPKLGLDNSNFTSEKFIFNIMLLDNKVFEHRFFRIKDTTVFKSKNQHNGISRGCTFNLKGNSTQVPNMASREVGSYCVSHFVFEGCPYPLSEECRFGCDMCDLCSTEYLDCFEPSSGGGFVSPQGGGGTQIYPNIIGSNNGGDNEFPFAPDKIDKNGFLLSRKVALAKLLQQEPGALLPCDSLNYMPLNSETGFGKMYQAVAQHLPSQDLLNRLDSLSFESIANGDDVFRILRLDSAKGSEVNCDFFPLRISQLPFKNGVSGPRYTHSELLEYFRLNIDSFITPSIGVSFTPYNHNGINEFVKFTKPSSSADGALVHIKMAQDGTVMQSGHTYSVSTTAGLPNSISFTFTTVWSPLDGYHPVSGNRRFGIYRSPTSTNPNEFTFYTMGVDRISTKFFENGSNIMDIFGNNGFEDADELWTNMQSNMINFINKGKGSASLYSQQRIVARPEWGLVGQYLMGQISLSTLKLLMGC